MSDRIIDNIELIRTDNNKLWMDILRIAMEKAPEETKQILVNICHNDHIISEFMRRLAK